MALPRLPLDQVAIQRILPHRYPFLFVDTITVIEPDRRIVGVKHVSIDEPCLLRMPGHRPVLPSAVLMEAVAQVGAILVLIKPENRDKLVFFMGIQRVRYRGPVYAGEAVTIEAIVKKLNARMGQFAGTARVDGRLVARGAMSFALAPLDSFQGRA